jgi:hypothetical protein
MLCFADLTLISIFEPSFNAMNQKKLYIETCGCQLKIADSKEVAAIASRHFRDNANVNTERSTQTALIGKVVNSIKNERFSERFQTIPGKDE